MYFKIDASSTLTTNQLRPGMVVLDRNNYLHIVARSLCGNIVVGMYDDSPYVRDANKILNEIWTPVSDYTITISSKELLV